MLLLGSSSLRAEPTDSFTDDVVYVMADTTGGTGAPLTMDTEALAVSFTGSSENGSNTGTAEGAASLAGGFIKSKVSATTTVCCQAGQANIQFGVVTKINLFGPADVGGMVAVRMQITGSYGCCGALNHGQIYVQSAYVDGPDCAVAGRVIQRCAVISSSAS